MNIKLYDSELKVMEILWERGDTRAKEISDILNEEIGWNINTTYTVIKKCVEKGAIERREPNYICHALITKEQVQNYEIDELVDKVFDNSISNLFSALVENKKLPEGMSEKLKSMIEELS